MNGNIKQERIEFMIPQEVAIFIKEISKGNDEILNKSNISRTLFKYGISFFVEQYGAKDRKDIEENLKRLIKWSDSWTCDRSVLMLCNVLKEKEKKE